jgi:hypothetical protein
VRRLLLFCVLLTAAACGSSDTSPSGGTAQVGFLWSATVTQTTASGGQECLISFQAANGQADTWTIQINQNDTALTASAASVNSGQQCNYTGTVNTSQMTLNLGTCTPAGFTISCNGNARDIYIVSRSLTGNTNATNATIIQGTTAETWNVYNSGDQTTILSTIKTTGSFIFRR